MVTEIRPAVAAKTLNCEGLEAKSGVYTHVLEGSLIAECGTSPVIEHVLKSPGKDATPLAKPSVNCFRHPICFAFLLALTLSICSRSPPPSRSLARSLLRALLLFLASFFVSDCALLPPRHTTSLPALLFVCAMYYSKKNLLFGTCLTSLLFLLFFSFFFFAKAWRR